MKINNKKVLLFPEFHLTDFPPQISLSVAQAHEIVKPYQNFGFDLIICGYIENLEGKSYSSCLIMDGPEIFNIRKRNPDKEEVDIICAGEEHGAPLNLSIGTSYFLICRDIRDECENGKMQKMFDNFAIENLFLISAMFHNFKENVKLGRKYITEKKIKRFIVSDRFNGIKVFE